MAVSTLRFGALPGKGTATGIGIGIAASGGSTGAATTTADLSFVGTRDSEISRTEKITPVGDEQVQSHKGPSLLLTQDDPR
jgi:hypothetical protein